MNSFKKLVALLLAVFIVFSLIGCGSDKEAEPVAEKVETVQKAEVGEEKAEPAPKTEPAPAAEEKKVEVAPAVEEKKTEEVSEPEKKDKALLVVSFGTSYNSSREKTIGAVEKALENAYPEYEVRRAFTSQIIIDILNEREGIEIDNVREAMERLVADGIKDVVIQPTHVMSGYEYDDVVAEASEYKDSFESFVISEPLLYDDSDYDDLISVLIDETSAYDDGETAIVFMGHGTSHSANSTYRRLQNRLSEAGYDNYFIGTVEAVPSLDDVIDLVRKSGLRKVVLHPLMVVAGDHANNDMAGDEPDSWKSAFTAAGFDVECVLNGLGQYEGIQNMYVKKASDAMKGDRPVLLAVSFGTSYTSSRDKTIGAIERSLQEAYPEYEVRRAFTSDIIIDILENNGGHEIDSVIEAMERMIDEGRKDVLIQPTHIMSGYEYDDAVFEVEVFRRYFDSMKIGSSLLASDEDYSRLVKVLDDETAQYRKPGTVVVFMGHGTSHEANSTYAKLQKAFADAGINDIFIGTVEAVPDLNDVIEMTRNSGAEKVVLLPLMIVAGDHANNDMAGDEPDSWKSAFTAAGFDVECVLNGLGQYEGVRQMIVDHAGKAVEVPARITADMLNEGDYEITVRSSSSMFKIVKCILHVGRNEMTADMTMSGKGYGKLFMGTGSEALEADESRYIQSQIAEDGTVSFTVPVEALDDDIDCAAWSIKKSKWYDRVIVFESDSLPEKAFD